MRRHLKESSYWKYFNYSLLSGTLMISLISLLVLYSIHTANHSSYYKKQALFLLLGLVLFVLVSRIDPHRLISFAPYLYGLFLLSLLFLLVFSPRIAGAKAWVGIGGMGIQPSEFGKIIVILLIARVFRDHDSQTLSFKDILRLGTITGAPVLLIMAQPDMGTAVTYSFILLTLFILLGLKKEMVLLLVLSIVGVSYLGWNFVFKDYQKERVKVFMHPESDPLKYGYHTIQSKITIGSGGLKGKGYLQGTQKGMGFLPAQHTDFILSVYAEEFGFLGILFLFGSYFFLFSQIYGIASGTEDVECFLLGSLLLGQIFFPFLINVLVSIGKLPVAGITLPFMSYGGSSLLTLFIMIGIIEGIHMKKYAGQ